MSDLMYVMTITKGEWEWLRKQVDRRGAPLGLKFALESATLAQRYTEAPTRTQHDHNYSDAAE